MKCACAPSCTDRPTDGLKLDTDYKQFIWSIDILFLEKNNSKGKQSYNLLSPSNWSSVAGDMIIVFLRIYVTENADEYVGAPVEVDGFITILIFSCTLRNSTQIWSFVGLLVHLSQFAFIVSAVFSLTAPAPIFMRPQIQPLPTGTRLRHRCIWISIT